MSRGTVPRVRVLRVITRLNIGGPSIQAIELTTRLADRGYDTLLVHGSPDAGEGDMRYLLEGRRPDRFAVRHVPFLRRRVAPIDDVRAAAALFSLLRGFRPDVVHTHMAKAGTVGRIAALAYNRIVRATERARLVHTYHGHVHEGYFSPAKARVFAGIERLLARRTDRIVAISPRIRSELVDQHRIGRPDQYRVVPLGFDLSAFAAIDDGARAAGRRALGLAADRGVVTTVGRLTAIKQQRLFLETAAALTRCGREIDFLIAGDGELHGELERAARDLGVADRVRFLGWRRDLPTLYAATDVFLLTSRNEGTPVALIEAMAAGCAGVSTDVGGVRDVVTDDRVGRVAAFGDVQAIADHVRTLIDNPALRRGVAEAGRRHVLEQFNLDRLLDDIDDLYHSLGRGDS